jgi:Ca2+-binding RTX toxin-like protein
MIFGGAGGDTIRSGGNADVLVGGDGNDDLIAGSDRDVLVGGNGADTLTSGNGEDILVAGRTSYDDPTAANLQALAKIQNEWTRTDAAYSVRFWHLAGTLATGGLNGTFLLKVQTAGKTVFDDAAPDVLTGGGGTDWFIARRAQAVKDNVIFVAGETVTEV